MRPAGQQRDGCPGNPIYVSQTGLKFKVSQQARTPGIRETATLWEAGCQVPLFDQPLEMNASLSAIARKTAVFITITTNLAIGFVSGRLVVDAASIAAGERPAGGKGKGGL
jgi:hypothetical protein